MPLHFRVAWQLVVKFLPNVGNPLNLAHPLLGLISVLKCLVPIKFGVAWPIFLGVAKFVGIEQSYLPNVASQPHFAEFDEYPLHLNRKVRSQSHSKLDAQQHLGKLLKFLVIPLPHGYQKHYFDLKDKRRQYQVFVTLE